MVKCATVKWMFIFQCILCLDSQIIYFTNSFDQVDVPSGKIVFIELSRYFKSDGVCLCYEKFINVFLDRGFVDSKVYPCMFTSKDVFFVVYMDGYLFENVHNLILIK